MADEKYSVTLTGKVRAGRDAPAVWQRVAVLLKLEAEEFRERVLARLPMTLKAVDHASARRQQEALSSAGANALLLAEDPAPRVWLRENQRTCGPLSMAYVRYALREQALASATPACLQGSKQWQDVQTLVDRHPPPANVAAPAATTAKPARENSAKLRRPAHRQGPSGRSSAAIVIVASLALIAALLALVAWPAWRAAQARAAIQQRIEASAPMRATVAAYFRAHAQFPDDAAQAGMTPVPGMTLDHGDIRLDFGADAAPALRGRHVRLVPAWSQGRVSWRCRSAELPRAALPASCR